MSVERKLTGSINLEKLEHVKRKMNGKNGKIDCLVIPVESNGLYKGEKGTYMDLKLIINNEEGEYGDIGFVAKQTGYKNLFGKDSKWNNLNEEQKQKVKDLSPILGNVRDLENNWGDPKDFEEAPNLDEEEDDFPF